MPPRSILAQAIVIPLREKFCASKATVKVASCPGSTMYDSVFVWPTSAPDAPGASILAQVSMDSGS